MQLSSHNLGQMIKLIVPQEAEALLCKFDGEHSQHRATDTAAIKLKQLASSHLVRACQIRMSIRSTCRPQDCNTSSPTSTQPNMIQKPCQPISLRALVPSMSDGVSKLDRKLHVSHFWPFWRMLLMQ